MAGRHQVGQIGADGILMATAETHGFALEVAERLAILEALLAHNPACAVGVLDPAWNIGDAAPALADVGIRVDGYAALKAGALVEYLAVSDVWLMSDAALEAGVHGSATRTVRLRDGQRADLHLIEISDSELTTVAIIVPGAGETIAATPPPTAVAASPRVGVVLCDAFGLITSASTSTLVLLGRPSVPLEGTPAVHLAPP
jgi:hypothetical protein